MGVVPQGSCPAGLPALFAGWLDGCGERPAQVHGIAQPQVKSLASERRVNVRGIAR